MAKASGKEILARIKKQQKEDQRSNVTFRLNIALMDRLRAKCEKEKVAMSEVIEGLIKDFLE
ncbi:MAG: hypothetical protein K2X29_11165 [Candidatus Obscuribacterales bacterium]|nr:hypothetical protein [Candidatus Obscuribacterales bacterium]